MEPALPIRSEVIAIASVRDLRAYLSSDRTTVYYEATLSIQDVFKGRDRLTSGVEVTAERSGGAVRFSSGKILRRGTTGRYAPIAGHTYLLFLNSIEGDAGFSLVTGYDLAGDRVVPLDDSGEGPYENYQYYRNKPVSKLLDDLRKALRG